VKTKLNLFDIKCYFEKRKKTYLLAFGFIVVGIIVGIFIATSSERYLSLLKSSDKTLFDYINGKISFSKQFFSLFLKFFLPMVVVFVVCLSSYSSFLGFVFLAYNGVLFFLNTYAIIAEFGITGVLSFVFLILPTNLLLFAVLIFFFEVCGSRCKMAKAYRNAFYGFGEMEFWFKLLLGVIVGFIAAFVLTFVFLIVLKSHIFMIY